MLLSMWVVNARLVMTPSLVFRDNKHTTDFFFGRKYAFDYGRPKYKPNFLLLYCDENALQCVEKKK